MLKSINSARVQEPAWKFLRLKRTVFFKLWNEVKFYFIWQLLIIEISHFQSSLFSRPWGNAFFEIMVPANESRDIVNYLVISYPVCVTN